MGRQQKPFVFTPTKRRGPIAAEFQTPGPAAIKLPATLGTGGGVKARSPAFTLSSRPGDAPKVQGPGPGTYNVSGVSNKGKEESIAASMHAKPKDPTPFLTPGPGDYRPEAVSTQVLKSSPNFSFGLKTDVAKPSAVPAPNTYSIPGLLGSVAEGSKVSSPAFTMSGRSKDIGDKMKVPGPGSYDPSGVDAYKAENSPAFSMGQRTVIPGDHTTKPGPGVYSPEKCEVVSTPEYSFGVKHSPYVGSLRDF